MQQLSNVVGFAKVIFNIRLRITVFLFFLQAVMKRDLTIKKFVFILRRLLIFLSKMQHNKFVKIGNKTRMDLYVPGFPSPAFYTACKKFMTFGEKLPCTTALLSITSACTYSCKHCYQRHDKGKDIEIDILIKIVKRLQNLGIAFFNIEGGEPFLVYDRLKKVCEALDTRSEIWINSTGHGVSLEKLLELRKTNVTAIMFSLHSHDPEYVNQFMGNSNAWGTMINAIEMCHQAGIAVALNTCLQREAFYDGTFEKVMDCALELKAAIVQIIKPKPAGGWLERGADYFSEEDTVYIKDKVNKYNNDPQKKHYPAISAQIIEEDKDVFGCTAGGTDRFYINAKGDLQPCEFLNISFGNIKLDDFDTIYKNMRKHFEKPGECFLCERYSPDILKLFKENNLESLPISPLLSEKIYTKWERGSETDLYKRIEGLK